MRSRKPALTACRLPAAADLFKMETPTVLRSKTRLQDFFEWLGQTLCMLFTNWQGHAATSVLLSGPVTWKIISNCKIDGIQPSV